MRTVLGAAPVLALVLALAATGPAVAGDAKVGPVEIKGAWARASAPSAKVGGAFMTVVNTGSDGDGDALVSASSPVAKTAELHVHIHDGDVMRMRAVDTITVRPGQRLTFEPGGLHVMLIDLVKPLKQGESFPLTLNFAKAGSVTVNVDVQAVGAMGPGAQMPMHQPGTMSPAEYQKMHEQHMKDPAHKAMHEEHMKDPAHKSMHEQMHGKQ